MAVTRVKVKARASPGPIEARVVALEADRLAVERAGRIVVAEVTFRLGPGEALLVSGRNGAGKSTLLRCLAGLLPAAAGRVALNGAGRSASLGEYVHYLGHADGLKRSLTAAENLRVAVALLGRQGAPGLTPQAALERQGLAFVGDLPAGFLSAGQRRRVALARVLVAPRPIWIFDEPATGLDVAAQADLAALVAAHRAEGGVLVIAAHGASGVPDAAELALGKGA